MTVSFIGTSHIAEQSVRNIKQSFLSLDPDIVAIELDKRRFQALFSEEKPSYSPRLITKIGFAGYLFAVIGGSLQKKFGRMVGMQPGADMKQAAILAGTNKKQLLLIDQDISITLKKLSKTLTRKEKWRFISDILFGWAKKQEKVKINLNDVPQEELINKLLVQLKGRYPSFYKVLVEDRNKHMARNLAVYSHEHPDKHILAVIGAGHEQGLKEEYEKTITFLNTQASKQAA